MAVVTVDSTKREQFVTCDGCGNHRNPLQERIFTINGKQFCELCARGGETNGLKKA